MARVVVLGCAGSGKTTLARRLGRRLSVPVICLDAIWQPQWSDADVPTFRALLREAHAGEAWVSDGNFARATFDIRLPRADQVVWLDLPRLQCAWRAIARVFRRSEAHDLRGLAKVLRYIAGFERINRPLIEAERLGHGPKVPVRHLRSNREVDAFVDSCARGLCRPSPQRDGQG